MNTFQKALTAALLAGTIFGSTALAAPSIGNDAFRRVWDRQDRAVAEQVSGRSWTWGPAPISDAVRETFVDGAEGRRVVQYFDKSRMEINDPTADPNSAWYVTNGLLPIELMTGRLQISYNQFEQRSPAKIADRRPRPVSDVRRPAAPVPEPRRGQPRRPGQAGHRLPEP